MVGEWASRRGMGSGPSIVIISMLRTTSVIGIVPARHPPPCGVSYTGGEIFELDRPLMLHLLDV